MKLHYRRYGNGPPLLILHGLLGSLTNWNTIGKALSPYFDIWLIDQRNHGRSPHSDSMNYDVMKDDIMELVNEHKLQNITLLGHSMGGKTAMLFALEYENITDRVIVGDIAPKAYLHTDRSFLDTMINIDLGALQSRNEVDNALKKTVQRNADRQFLLQNLYWHDTGTLAWRANLDAIKNNISAINAELKTDKIFKKPALFIRGGDSDYISEEDIPLLHQLFPMAEVNTIPGAGHWIHADKPWEFLKIILHAGYSHSHCFLE